MKKKLLSIILAGAMILGTCFTSLAAPENTDNTENTESTDDKEDSEDDQSPYLTGTQQMVDENTTNVDEDIQAERDQMIPVEYEYITISTTDEFLDFARNCQLDIWSVNKKVTLANDISLLNKDFDGVPTFGGIFDGAGHTISGLTVSDGVSYTGLFCHIQQTGVIRSLNVTGNIIPSGNQTFVGGIVGNNEGALFNCSFKGVVKGSDYVGGIAGMNKLTGIISGCKTEGYVQATHFTGGIAGENMGSIVRCINESMVNTENIDQNFTLETFNKITSVINDYKKGDTDNHEADADMTTTDAGGIAGLSIGIISRSINNGNVGYSHVGYNIGGIAGRQSGYIVGCTNNGQILGRKDVGGIVGQAEPYITVDLSTDVAYQLSQSISDLHDIVTATISDAKAQSNIITNRLSAIQQFTAGAVNDLRYLSGGTIDFVNGVTSATTEAFSRVDYVIDEASKKDGVIDQVRYAARNTRESADALDQTVQDLDIYQYMDEGERQRYDAAKERIHEISSEYSDNYTRAMQAYYNAEVEDRKNRTTPNLKYRLNTPIDNGDGTYTYYLPASGQYDLNNPRTDLDKTPEEGSGTLLKGTWVHVDDAGNESYFPDPNNSDDSTIDTEATNEAAQEARQYAELAYFNQHGTQYYEDLATNTSIIADTVYSHMDEMSESSRADASNAMNNLEEAAANLETAGDETKRIFSTVSGYDNIVFPQLNDEYRARTTSLADNMQGMNDNFGFLNQEVNNANGVLLDDLQAMADKFNDIMLLYSDALDGALEMDYTTAFEDVSLEEANTCVDATVADCINYGEVNGDISVSGIAGTMAIEYDYDLESDITGVKNSKVNTSYITKCVLRQDKNYGEVYALKDNAGGICGLQEMGTIIDSGNFSNVETTSGEYAGGISGKSVSYIIESSSRGIISGSAYIGGIAGEATHVRDCFSIIDIRNAEKWYGAIAGHVTEEGVVRNNFFVSDELAGIDRVSYSLKAEPTSYRDAMTSAPSEFNKIMITFVVVDTDDTRTNVSKVKKNYGDALSPEDFPVIDEKEGYYISFDNKEGPLYTDQIVEATYVRYKTTIAEDKVGEDFRQAEVLVDGDFKEDDTLVVERTVNVDMEEYTKGRLFATYDNIENYENLKITIPDDGKKTHIVRFRVDVPFSHLDLVKEEVYLVKGDSKEKLEKVGSFGQYSLYEIEGNQVELMVNVRGINSFINILAVVFFVLVFALIMIFFITGYSIAKNGRRVPRIARKLYRLIHKKIEGKENIFYNEDEEEKEEKEEKEQEKEEEIEKEKEDKDKK